VPNSEWFWLKEADIEKLKTIASCDSPDSLPDWCPNLAKQHRRNDGRKIVQIYLSPSNFEALTRVARKEGRTMPQQASVFLAGILERFI